MKRKYVIFAALAAVVIALDQWTKVLARTHLRNLGFGGKKTVIEGFFDLRYSENPGVAFGMFQDLADGRIILTAVAMLALAMVGYYLYRAESWQVKTHAALGLIGGGAIGNVIDRVIYGRVTDFIVWRYKQYEWPAFNIADAALVVGVALLLLDMRTVPKESAPEGTPQHEKA